MFFSTPQPSPPMTQRPASKLLILGWDAADWIMIRRLTDKGALPHLRRLMQGGVHADLATLEPRLSPLLWSTIATGKTADKHGILNFVEPDAQSDAQNDGKHQNLRPTSSTTRKTKALWNILHQSGLRTHVVSWYASHPAEPVRGCVVSNLLCESQPTRPKDPWPLLPGTVHPDDLSARIAAARVHPGDVPERVLAKLVPQWAKLGRDHPRIRTLTRLVAQCLSVHAAARTAMQADPTWDAALVFHEAIDTIGHHFMQFYPPRMKHVQQREFELFSGVMPGVYALHDELLGEMLRLAGPDATVVLLSDHGFHSGDQRPVTEGLSNEQRAATEAAWHREHGILVMRGPGIRAASAPHAPGLLDIAPTALALLGLSMGRDMDGRVLTESLTEAPPEPIDSWDAVPGDDARHPDDLRQDPFEAHDAIRQLVDLGYMAALPEDAVARVELTRRETAFNLGAVHLSRGRFREAADVFGPLAAEHPAEARYALSLARALIDLARFDEAEEILARLAAAQPEQPPSPETVLLRVGGLAAAGRKDQAAALLDAVLTDPAFPKAALAEACNALERWDEAVGLAQAGLSAAPGDPALLLGLARAEIGRGRFEPAAERCLDVLESRPTLPEANHLLGTALAWLGEHAHALQAFEAAVAVQPARIEAQRFLAALHRAGGNHAKAAEHDAKADSILSDPASDQARRALADRPSPRGPAAWAARHAAPGAGA
jgi:predicted AlkP superfamily phosphohydrolase/phosphomutase/tetratricopeptide (TPR) repeat protein